MTPAAPAAPFVSVLNDVLGPVMRGPSSSHTAGAYRIAKILRALFGAAPTAVRCAFDPDGSYAPTYRPLGVDLAFAAGVLGWEMTDPRYHTALSAAASTGARITFAVEPLDRADHPNTVYVEMESPRGGRMTAWARSIGGGVIEITRVDDRDLLLDGKAWDLLLVTSAAQAPGVLAEARALVGGTWSRSDDHREPPRRQAAGAEAGELLHGILGAPIPAEMAETLCALAGVREVRTSPPVFFPRVGAACFESASQMLAAAESGPTSLGRSVLRAEAALLGKTEEEIAGALLERFAVMRRSVDLGLDDGSVAMPLTRPSAARIWAAERRGELAGGLASRAAIRAMACMHTCNSKGVVCAAPTGGSAGVIPGVLVTLAEERGLSDDDLARALCAAGGIGLIVAIRATFAAETAGCQVEIGVAGAMAAAAVVELAGGTPRQACDAASIALQNTMGMVCDPVQGGCEIPCHTRNAAAAAGAFVCADLVLGGYRNPIPLDEAIDASYAVGRMLPRELRCTALGGIAVTPSALALGARG